MSEALQGVALFAGLCAPLAVTSTLHEPKLTGLGLLLHLGLARITINALPKDALVSASVEAAAIASLVSTSSTNRLCRLALGSVHILAAVALAARHASTVQKSAKDEEKKDRKVQLLRSAMNFGGVLILCVLAGMWLSSGYYGQ